MKKIFYILLCVIVVFCAEIPKLTKYATDYTGTLTPAQLESLNRDLKLFDDSTSNQIVFLMISGKDVDDIFDYSIKVANENQIGTKEKQNGVLLIVFKDIRKLRIEVGRGLEGALTDAVSNSIIRNEIAPYFKQGKFYEGIVAGLSSIRKACKNEYTIPKKKKSENSGWFVLLFVVAIIIFFILSAIFGSKKSIITSRRTYWGSGIGGGIGGFGGGWGSFGGSSGGGDWGGFSGGGGSFGGGGSSGSW